MPIYSLSPDEMVRDLINRKNETALVAFDKTNLIIGKAAVLSNDPTANTKVNVRGVQNEVYAGQLQVTYNRLDLGVLFQGNYRAAFTALGQSSLYKLLPDLNRGLGLNLTEQDVQDIDLKLLDHGDQVTLEIRAKPGSMAYIGFMRVLFNRRQVLLTDVVTEDSLAAFTHPDPVLEGYQSAGLLTWGQDFTLIQQHLRVNRYGNNYKGSWISEANLRDALAEYYGIDNWPRLDTSQASKMTVRDMATSAHPDANRDFQRVVVQTNLRSNGYSGTAFFHYNP